MPALTFLLQLVFECWIGRYPFLQPGQELRDLDEEEVLHTYCCPACAHSRVAVMLCTHAGLQVLACIDDENERGVRSLVAADARMGEQMKSFLLRCLDRSPNTRPAAINLMKDPWLAGADQQVRAFPATAFPFLFALEHRALTSRTGSARIFTIARRLFGRTEAH